MYVIQNNFQHFIVINNYFQLIHFLVNLTLNLMILIYFFFFILSYLPKIMFQIKSLK